MNKHSFSNCESTIGKCGICAAYLNKMNIKQTWFQMSSAPKDGTMILVAFRTYDKPIVRAVYWNSFTCSWVSNAGEFLTKFLGIPKFWTRIPSPPNVEELESINLGGTSE